MNKLCLMLGRNVPIKSRFLTSPSCLEIFGNKNKSTSGNADSDNEGEKKKSQPKKTSNESLEKLHSLLQRMVEEDAVNTKSKLKLAQPQKKERIKEVNTEAQSEEKQMVNAVKDVAESIGGDVKQTESELLLKLLNPEQTDKPYSSFNLSDIVKGMKIDRETKPAEQQSRAEQVKQLLNRVNTTQQTTSSRGPQRKFKRTPIAKKSSEMVYEKIDLFGAKPLGIFTDKTNLKEEGFKNETWSNLYKRELKLAVTHPPSNFFQQMILWTEQGKVWKFPIDNEQGLEEEKSVCFSEHVFLEKHLEPWCPQKGPIRHFMELVCVGLSKNPYLTVEAKKEHIEWYKNYFDSKRQLLQEVGAIPAVSKKEASKQIKEK